MIRFLLQLFLWALALGSCPYTQTEAAAVVHSNRAFMLMPSAPHFSRSRSVFSVAAAAADPDEELNFEAQAKQQQQSLPQPQPWFELEGQHAGAGGYFFGPPPPPALPWGGPKGGKGKGTPQFVMLVTPVVPVVPAVVEQPVTPVIKETIIQPRVEVRTVVTPVMVDQKSENAPITEKAKVVSHTETVVQPTQQKKTSSSIGSGARYAAPSITTLTPVSLHSSLFARFASSLISAAHSRLSLRLHLLSRVRCNSSPLRAATILLPSLASVRRSLPPCAWNERADLMLMQLSSQGRAKPERIDRNGHADGSASHCTLATLELIHLSTWNSMLPALAHAIARIRNRLQPELEGGLFEHDLNEIC